ncbi:hypothetical protein M378DRAFT_12910 [Amanita muscaria Koide BX008]|uniref:Uncharacterized protein n=1 Tax=Amanita muscaria (strain Koide BX008) TaxID=946122 RepID=A0A0C2SGS6_AMAMK|nr:hypothetical protein M378DRAFT_12910 [Amanita muscaria Koide BX008]
MIRLTATGVSNREAGHLSMLCTLLLYLPYRPIILPQFVDFMRETSVNEDCVVTGASAFDGVVSLVQAMELDGDGGVGGQIKAIIANLGPALEVQRNQVEAQLLTSTVSVDEQTTKWLIPWFVAYLVDRKTSIVEKSHLVDSLRLRSLETQQINYQSDILLTFVPLAKIVNYRRSRYGEEGPGCTAESDNELGVASVFESMEQEEDNDELLPASESHVRFRRRA